MDCVVCHGERGRARRSDGSAICLHDGCKRDYAKRRRGSNGDGDILLAEKLPKEPRHECRKITDVLGVSLCLTSGMTSEEMRIAVANMVTTTSSARCVAALEVLATRSRISYLTLGGSSWKSSSVLWTIPQLKKLFTFARQLEGLLERAEERLREDEEA